MYISDLIYFKREEQRMNKKLVGIFVMTLLIATAIPAMGIKIDIKIEKTDANDNISMSSVNDYYPKSPPPWWLIGADQKLTTHCGYGDEIIPPYIGAQEFKPTKDKLTAVALSFFKHDAPSGLKITVYIRDDLNGDDLATKSVDADNIIKQSGKETWVLFDFTDITVTPETTYYILCSINGGTTNESILWFFNINNQYDRGGAWFSIDSGENWIDLEDHSPDFPQIDFCFITYYQKPKSKTINMPLILQNLLIRFPLFEKILNQIL